MTDATGQRPARGYSWPPFEPSNEVGVRHGAFSPRKVDPFVAELIDAVLADDQCAHVRPAWCRPALYGWARAEAQAQLLTEYLARRAEEAGDGVGDLADERVRSGYLLLHRAEARALTGRARLGLDPLSRARLGRDLTATGVDMAKLLSGLHAPAVLDGEEEVDGDDSEPE